MRKYPGRVYSKPEFTALPPFIFSGAEFALIPSRDEPFGLVAVEFGRKGALGVGSRVGGLGQMPGMPARTSNETRRGTPPDTVADTKLTLQVGGIQWSLALPSTS